jgi:hypothetical protein
MIIWLASYPKSGNTLLRSMLATYFFSDDGNFNFNHLYKIGQFPSINTFLKLGLDISDENKIFENYIKAQAEVINVDKSIKFLKTHSSLVKINNCNFTDHKNTAGAIYVVRDPRNVATSLSHHMGIDEDNAVNIMLNDKEIIPKTDKTTTTFLGSWRVHYNSWKNLNNKTMLIKYEDLIENKKTLMIKIFKYFNKLEIYSSKLDMEKLNRVLKSTEFKLMQKLEKTQDFTEGMIDKKTGTRKSFFRSGPDNDWKKDLKKKNIEKIEQAFEKEMIELGYM